MKRRPLRGSSMPSEATSNGTSKAQYDPAEPLAGAAKRHLFHTLLPLSLMVTCPSLVILLWYTAVKCDGSWMVLGEHLSKEGILAGIAKIWSEIHIGSSFSMSIILGYCVFALILQVILPGPTVKGPVTPKGNIPVYKDNGFFCFTVTMAVFCGLTYYLKQHGMSPTIVYDRLDEFMGGLTVFSHIICILLVIKGLSFPSTTDSGSTGNLVFDYYWGTELYPRVLGVDIKVFTNCRFGLTVWPLLVLIYAIKNYELYGFVDSMWVSATLHMLYFIKFFWWESGYMGTMDIVQDRAGFYICWGCLAFVPGLYASTSLYLVNQPVHLGPFWSIVILVVGIASLVINYLADKQKQDVRRTNGNCLIWGRKPDLIRAQFEISDGSTRESLLLVSGYWGLARHFHYIPELMLAFFWSVPALFSNLMGYSYFIWLLLLLTHRTYRDDSKCIKKYGKYWDEYRKKVPYKMIPGVF